MTWRGKAYNHKKKGWKLMQIKFDRSYQRMNLKTLEVIYKEK